MRCESCGVEGRIGIAFCETCGARLREPCGTCGAALAPAARFCGACGAPVVAEGRVDLSREPAMEAERKQVSVLFVDVVRSTGLAERLGPERMHETLDAFFRVAVEEMGRVGGVVHKQLGDGFMAVFGIDRAIEDHADRAVLAGLAVRDRVERELSVPGDGGPEPLRVRAGIESGVVVVGTLGGAAASDTIGDAANVAARLQARGEPGDVVIGGATAALLRCDARLRPLGELSLRGRSARVPAHVVDSVAPERSALAGIERRSLVPLSGRDGALATLADLLEGAMEGRGHAVAISGEPGIGKSRLVLELRGRVASWSLTVLEGRCLPYGQAIPYGPIVEVIRADAGIPRRASRERAASQLGAALDAAGVDRVHQPYLLALVADAAALPDGITPEAAKLRTFAAVRALLLGESRRRPLMLVIEDVHWADRTSEDLLDLIVDDLDDEPLLLVTTHRPPHRVPWLNRPHATQLALRALARDAASAVAAAAAGQPLPEPVLAAIVSRADGNPLFIEELAASAGDGADTVIPATVHDVIAASVDRLPRGLRRLLQTAAVLGREFSPVLLERVWDGEGSIGAALDELRRAGFLAERPGASPGYVFKHALTRDVVENSLLQRRREALHRAAAAALAELYAGRETEVLDRLAYHHARGGDPAAAVDHLSRLAAANAGRYAHAEARSALEEALVHARRLPPGDRERAAFGLTVQLVGSLYFLGELEASERLLGDLAPVVPMLGDAALATTFHFWRAHTLSHLGEFIGAEGNATLALRGAEARGDVEGVGRAGYLLCREAWWRGRHEEGLAIGRRAAAALEAAEATWWLVHCRCYVGHNLLHAGDVEGAVAEADAALAAGVAAGDPRLRSFAGWSRGIYLATGGDPEAAVEACEAAVAVSPDPVNTAWARGMLGFAMTRAGRHDHGAALLEPALADAHRAQHTRVAAWFGGWLAEALLAADSPERARAAANLALEEAERVRVPWAAAVALRVRGQAALAAGSVREARASLHEAHRRQVALRMPLEAARTADALERLGGGPAPGTVGRDVTAGLRSD
jgi:class 3 adenylate cyclase/tetratricopeptide (TPR) repeat protein